MSDLVYVYVCVCVLYHSMSEVRHLTGWMDGSVRPGLSCRQSSGRSAGSSRVEPSFRI